MFFAGVSGFHARSALRSGALGQVLPVDGGAPRDKRITHSLAPFRVRLMLKRSSLLLYWFVYARARFKGPTVAPEEP